MLNRLPSVNTKQYMSSLTTPLSSVFSDSAAETSLAQANRQMSQNYSKNYSPFIDQMIGEINSTELIDTAKEDAASLLAKTTKNQNLDLSRGVTALTPAQQKLMQRTNAVNASAQGDANVNNARVDQETSNFENLSNLMSIAVNNQQSAVQGLADGTGMASSREQAYLNGQAQADSTNLGLATTAGAMLLMGI
ncbi:hypothetical protein [Alteromonas mediterranea]|uniref:Uncharacterized protein n=1 Tax=Alteromonas mediterranea (strain DSM 17117 / CIP 110805 / LMG 28347 / Deep ecotype) TaxID=1774373 RepID=F2GC91_ALTMD|nr:hypothetical protein [Alteromonas mediterranea]AEA99047.1 hypothetical protein MADE_1014565 [Alteromonas mediterranea DE]